MPRVHDPFSSLVAEARRLVPPEFTPYLENVAVQVEDWPSAALLEELEVPEEEGLYGVYLGTPLPARGAEAPLLPDRILLFRGPLEEDFPDPEELRQEIAITLVHEIAHHFGIGEERLRELGWD